MKTRIFMLLSLPFFVASMSAHAQSICRVYEYAELKDMPKEKLLEMRCEYYDAGRQMLKAALIDMQGGRQLASQSDQAISNRCSQEMTRMENILQSKYAVKELPKCFKATDAAQ